MPNLKIYTVYDNPKDFPGKFVIRGFSMKQTPDGRVPAPDQHPVFIGNSLRHAREFLQSQGLFPVPRSPGDDSVIVESWI